MAPRGGKMPPVLDAFELLGIQNSYHPDCFTCVAFAPSQGRRCHNPIRQANREAAKRMLANLPLSPLNVKELQDDLLEIAELTICWQPKQKLQTEKIAGQWYKTIVAEMRRQDRQAADTKPNQAETDGLDQEIHRLQRLLDDLQRAKRDRELNDRKNSSSKQSQGNGSRSRSRSRSRDRQEGGEDCKGRSGRSQEENRKRCTERETDSDPDDTGERARRAAEVEEKNRRDEERRKEARRQAQREKEEQEADARRKERQRQERQRKEEQARAEATREERERQAWNDSWLRYERDWSKMSQIDTAGLKEDVRDSLPWPVKDGRWQDVDHTNVKSFWRHTAGDAWADSPRCLRLLRDQSRRWHPDRMSRQFPLLAEDKGVMSLVNTVQQVINECVEEVRKRATSTAQSSK